MKYLMIDSIGLMLDLAVRTDGRVQIAFMDKEHWPHLGDGMVKKTTDPEGLIRKLWPDMVIIGDVAYSKFGDLARKKGIPVIGGDAETDRWELDRKYGQEILKKAGIPTIPNTRFTKISEARKFLDANPEKLYVSKPDDDHDDKSMSFVPKKPEHLRFMLDRWEKLGKLRGAFLLQEKIEGIEFAVSGWWTPNGWLDAVEENFEHKKLMAGDWGMNTGEMGTVVRYVPFKRSKIAQKVLKPLEGLLSKTKYCGSLDVNCIVDGKGNIWPLEFTSRFGYPSISIVQAVHNAELDRLWQSLVTGLSFPFNTEDVALGMVAAIPDFPYSKVTAKEVEDFPIMYDKHFHPYDVKNFFWTAGDYLGVMVDKGRKIGDVRRRVVRLVKDTLDVPLPIILRNDIGMKTIRQLPELWKHGLATAWKDNV